ncbi:IS91, orf2 [Escherichia coli]|uniref:hypothetical protein n=1 Tax=Escherichia coli TaxID=562 RepID=UPI000DFEE40C|nr:IS91, orf2 [Escherichia coli]
MASSAKARKRKPAPQRSKLPRYVVKLYDDDFFDEEDAEALRFDNFDDAVECCADLNIPFFVDAGNKKLVFWFVRVDDEGYPEIARCTEREFATILAGISAGGIVLPGVWHGSLAGRSPPALLMLPRFADIFQKGNRWLNWLEETTGRFCASGGH